ncbi:MAG: tail fiber domain-containing protein [Pyrinomonadaceae bacterium]
MKMRLFFVCFSVFTLFAAVQAQSSAFSFQNRANGLTTANVSYHSAFNLFELSPSGNLFTMPNTADGFFTVQPVFGTSLFKKFDVVSTNNLLITATFGTGTIPASGAGTRMMFYGKKAAFRVGTVSSTQWNDANIGTNSTAFGYNTTASGGGSTSIGQGTIASGEVSVAIGVNSDAKGQYSLAMGYNTTASGASSTTMGNNTTAKGSFSTAIGYGTTASGDSSFAVGNGSIASGDYSIAMGKLASTNGKSGSFVFSDNSSPSVVATATAPNQFVARASGGFFFRTDLTLSTGCNLPASSGAFTCSSSKSLKENFGLLNYTDVLERLRRIDVQRWNYKGETAGIFHIGAFAEDFYREFGLGADAQSIGLLDISGVNMAAIKALDERTENLQKENNLLREQLQKQQLMLEGLKTFVCSQNPQADVCR